MPKRKSAGERASVHLNVQKMETYQASKSFDM